MVVTGEPGTGKSTFLKKLANEWGLSKQESNKEKNDTRKLSVFAEFELLLLCVLRLISPQSSLFDILRFQFDFLSPTEMYACIDMVENRQENCLLLFDGLDEYICNSNMKDRTFRIITRDSFEQIISVTTSRPESIKHLRAVSKDAVQEHVNLVGFNKVQIENYASLYFKDATMTQAFMKHITVEKPQFLLLAKVPMRAEMMIFLWKKDRGFGDTLHDLFTNFTKYILQHMEKKIKQKTKELTQEGKVLSKYNELLLSISKVAYAWSKEGTMKNTFTEKDLTEKLTKSELSEVTKSGFLTFAESRSPFTPSLWYFTHLSIQEYFVAYYLKANQESTAVTEEFVYGCLTINGLKSRMYILDFLFGLSTKAACSILHRVVMNYKGDDSNKLLDILVSFAHQFGDSGGFSLPLPSNITLSEKWSNEVCKLLKTDQESGNRNLRDITVLLSKTSPDLAHAYVMSLTLEIQDGCNISKWKCDMPNLQELTVRIKSNRTASPDTNIDFDCLFKSIKSESIRKVSIDGKDVSEAIKENTEKLKNLQYIEFKEESQLGIKHEEQFERYLSNMKGITCSSNFNNSSPSNMFSNKNENIVCSSVQTATVRNLGDFLLKRKQQGHVEFKANGIIFNQSDIRPMSSSVTSILLNVQKMKIFGFQECKMDVLTLKTVSDILNIVGKQINSLIMLDLSMTDLASLGQYVGQCLRFLPKLETLLLKQTNISKKDLEDISNGYFLECGPFPENTDPLPIKYLDLTGNNLNEPTSEVLLFCENLTTIILTNCQVRGSLNTVLSKLCSESLTYLNMSGQDLSNQESIKESFNYFPNLRDVNLSNCIMSQEYLVDVVCSLPAHVTHLDISGQRDITQLVTSSTMQQSLSGLHQLTISSTSQDTEKLRWLLKKRNKNIEILISETKKGEPCVKHGIKNLPHQGKI